MCVTLFDDLPPYLTRTNAFTWQEALALQLHKYFSQYSIRDLLGGPRPWRMCTIINFFKGATLPVMLFLWLHFQGPQGPSLTGAVYVGLHGAYGIVWVFKDLLFPDKSWQDSITIPAGLFLGGGLLMYWAGGYFCMVHGEAPAALVLLAVLLWGVGVAVMIATDAQKHFTLRVKAGLITDGMFTLCRSPNYLGEVMLYAAYALLSRHPLPWIWLATVVFLYFWPNMTRKVGASGLRLCWCVRVCARSALRAGL